MACTATATKQVKASIIELLGLRSPVVLESSFNSEIPSSPLTSTVKNDCAMGGCYLSVNLCPSTVRQRLVLVREQPAI